MAAQGIHFDGHERCVRALCPAPGGLASGSDDGMVRLWSLASGREIRRLEGHAAAVTALCVLPNGRLASASEDRTVRLWDLAGGGATLPQRALKQASWTSFFVGSVSLAKEIEALIHLELDLYVMISILVPLYNKAPYVRTCLDSLLTSEGDLQIVICDDGSTDGSAEIAAQYARIEPRVRLVTQPNGGAASARNTAFKNAQGNWVLYFDADDCFAHGSLSALYEVAKRHPLDIVYCQWAKFHHDPEILVFPEQMHTVDLPGWQWMQLAFAHDWPTYPGSFLVPKGLVEAAGGWNENLSFQDDMEFYARMISRAPMMRFCKEALFRYREGAQGSLSNTASRAHIESHLLATRLAAEHLIDARDDTKSRAAAARQLMLVAHTQYLHAPDISSEAERLAKSLSDSFSQKTWLQGGTLRRLLQVLVGWKMALYLHYHLSKLRNGVLGWAARASVSFSLQK